MIYKGLKTSRKFAGDKSSKEKYFFFSSKIPSSFTMKYLKIPLGLVLAEVEAADDSVHWFDYYYDIHERR